MKRKNTPKGKYCPLADLDCLKEGCALYNEILANCQISVLSYNIYRLGNDMKPNGDK